MNPVLLKPGSDRRSHVVVMGQPGGRRLVRRLRRRARRHLAAAAYAAFDDLAARFDVDRRRGRGQPGRDQPARQRLRQHGPGPARADCPTVVVGDIDRGGVFAAMFGTVALLRAGRPGAGRRLRGQQVPRRPVAARSRASTSWRRSPAAGCTACCRGTPTCGWTPRTPSTSRGDARAAPRRTAGRRRAAAADQQLHRRRRARPRAGPRRRVRLRPARPRRRRPRRAAGHPVHHQPTWPGCAQRGLDRAITGPRPPRQAGARDLRRLPDARHGHRRPRRRRGRDAGAEVEGLGLLDVRTTSTPDKVLRLPTGTALGVPAAGYEIHHGRVTVGGGAEEFLGGARAGNVFGTMWHGSLEGDELRARVPRRRALGRRAVRSQLRRRPRAPARPARRPRRAAPRHRRAARPRLGKRAGRDCPSCPLEPDHDGSGRLACQYPFGQIVTTLTSLSAATRLTSPGSLVMTVTFVALVVAITAPICASATETRAF